MSDKSGSAMWTGRGHAGKGLVSTQSGALMDHPYGFEARFGDDHRGSSPEELLAAAHASSFAMAFSSACDKAGWTTDAADSRALVRLSVQGDGHVIDGIVLKLNATVPGLDQAGFQELAAVAQRNCPLCKALAGAVPVTVQATLDRPVSGRPETAAA